MICYGERQFPAKQRIKEIEEDLKREFIEAIQDPEEIQSLVFKIITSAAEKINIVISTVNTFKRYEREDIVELLTRKADEGVKVRMLLNQNPDIQQSIGKFKMHPQITIKNWETSVQTKVTTIVADKELSLVIELKDDIKHDSNVAIGLATYLIVNLQSSHMLQSLKYFGCKAKLPNQIRNHNNILPNWSISYWLSFSKVSISRNCN